VRVGVLARIAALALVGAVSVVSAPVVNSARKQIAELATKHRLPAIMAFAGFTEDGGLLAYGPDTPAIYAQAGGIVAKVLGGARPADTPIERPTRFALSVNQRTARTLNLTISNSLLLRADQVIQ
jgi:putative tryptophan/tyrosine transport system substrate-binding protein